MWFLGYAPKLKSPGGGLDARLVVVPLWDRYGRPLLNVRFVVTLRCNFRCFFCHSEGLVARKAPEMEPWEYEIVAEAAGRLGVKSFKVTGGEPLIRNDILDVIGALRRGHPRASISVTTNAYLLAEYAQGLSELGVDHVNVSLHSLNRERFRFITGVDGLENVLRGLEAARQHGLRVKINSVVLRGVNVDELWELVELASKLDASLQLIELHPVGMGSKVFNEYHMPYSEVVRVLEPRARKIRFRSELHNRVILELDNGVIVEVVGPTGNPVFCAGCTRIRVTPYGEMTPCLNRGDLLVEFRSAVRRAGSREEAVEAVIDAFRRVNALREPYYKYRLDTPEEPKQRRVYRIYLPKRSGVIPGWLEEKLLEAWGG